LWSKHDSGSVMRSHEHLEACGVDLYLDQQNIDTSTPMGKLVFQVTGAFAEFERSMIRQLVHAGLRRAVAKGMRLGRPPIKPELEDRIREALADGLSIRKTAHKFGVNKSTVQRVGRPFEGEAASVA
jgi:DNA invertase Pin-like site-specific DNA recombinase